MITLKFTNEIVIAEDEKTARSFLRRQKVKMSQVSRDGNDWLINTKYSEPKSNSVLALDPDAARQAKGW